MDQKVNFGLTAEDYARYRAGFPEAFFERVFDDRDVESGASVADLGTGTGTLARGFARRGWRVTGIDPAAQMLEQARALDQAAGLSVDYRVGTAEETGLENSSVEVVSAGQC